MTTKETEAIIGNFYSGSKPNQTTQTGTEIAHRRLTQHTNVVINTLNSSGKIWSRGPGMAKIVSYNTRFGRATGARARIRTKLGGVVPSTK